MKVAMVVPLPPPYGGIANWAVMLREYVKKQETIEFTYVNIAPKKRDLDGRTLWDRIVGQGFAMFAQKKNLRKVIKEEKVDVIHMTTSGQLATIRDIQMLKLAKKKKIPMVYHIRFGRIPEIAKNNTREWKLIKRAMRLASCVMVIDEKTSEAIREYLPNVNVCCVPNPFDVEKIQSFTQSVENQPEIVYLGWVIKTKGVEELLSAWDEVRKDYPDWKLRLIGPYDGEYVESLKERFSFEQVVLDGEQPHDEAMAALAKSSIFTLPSYTEGFPNVVLEAMALGKAVLATEVGAIPDMLGDCGVVIPAKSVQGIVDGLKYLLEDETLRNNLGEKAREKLMREYTLEKVVEEYKRIWNEIIEL